jgi:hypothetical protein
VKRNRIRIINPFVEQGPENDYAFYVKIPPYFYNSDFKLYINSPSQFDADLKNISIQYFFK